MAKKVYYSFEELENHLSEIGGYLKPYGTMGNHHCIVESDGDGFIVTGSVSGRVTITKGRSLGYCGGEVWSPPLPTDFRNPIKRFLCERKLPQKILVEQSGPVTATYGWRERPEGSCADTSYGSRVVWFGDPPIEKKVRNEDGEGLWSRSETTVEYEGGELGVVLEPIQFYGQLTSCKPEKVSQIIVRPWLDQGRIVTLLKEAHKRSII